MSARGSWGGGGGRAEPICGEVDVSKLSRPLTAGEMRRVCWCGGRGAFISKTYMARRGICAVCRLLGGGRLPMGGELALAALVVREHGVAVERAVEVSLVESRPRKTWSCHAVMNRCDAARQPREQRARWTTGGLAVREML